MSYRWLAGNPFFSVPRATQYRVPELCVELCMYQVPFCSDLVHSTRFLSCGWLAGNPFFSVPPATQYRVPELCVELCMYQVTFSRPCAQYQVQVDVYISLLRVGYTQTAKLR